MEQLRVQAFGRLRLLSPSGTIDTFGSRNAASLFALACCERKILSREHLLSLLWPGDDPESSRPRLRQELFRLRRALGSYAGILVVDRDNIFLDEKLLTVDTWEFAKLYFGARDSGRQTQLKNWTRAEQLYTDDLLPDMEGEWVDKLRRSFRLMLRPMLNGLASALVDENRAEEALPVARRAVRMFPGDESSQLSLIAAKHALGQTEDALEQLRMYEQRERSEGRRDASEALREMWARIGKDPQAPTRTSQQSVVATIRPPRPINPFFGRKTELQSIVHLVQPAHPDGRRLVTITGFGGIGKTRLAQEVAKVIADAGQVQAGFVSLVQVSDPEVLLQNMADVISPVREPTQDPYSTISSRLDGLPTVLVLDNFEDLVPIGVEVVVRLLEDNPLLNLLVTSRRPLGLLFEQVFPMAPLPVPNVGDSDKDCLATPSVALFLDQTRRVRPDFVAEGSSLESVSRLVAALEGIPLALMLAACRMRTLSPSDAERALTDRLSFLGKPQGGFEHRHRTMRACIEWTSDGLPEDVRASWLKLAVFRGGWTLDAAMAVLDEPQIVDLLEQLCDCSLVHQATSTDAARYAMYEPVRQYADELLDPAVREACNCEHAIFYTQFLEQISNTWFVKARGSSFESVANELDNIRYALEWSVAHRQDLAERICCVMRTFWSANGHHVEGMEWIKRILDLPEEHSDAGRRCRLVASAGIIAMDRSEFEPAREYYGRAYALAAASESHVMEGWIDLNFAHLDVIQGRVFAARPVQERALSRFTSLNNQTGIAHAMSDLGTSLVSLGEPDRGMALLETALDLRIEIGWDNGIAFAEAGLGSGLLRLNRLDLALQRLQSSKILAEALGDARVLTDVLADISECSIALGKLDDAESAYMDLREVCRRIGDRRGTIYAELCAARCALASKDLSSAVTLVRRAIRAAFSLGAFAPMLESLRIAANIGLDLGQAEHSLSLIHGVEELRKSLSVSTWPKRSEEVSRLVCAASTSVSSTFLASVLEISNAPSFKELEALAAAALATPNATAFKTLNHHNP